MDPRIQERKFFAPDTIESMGRRLTDAFAAMHHVESMIVGHAAHGSCTHGCCVKSGKGWWPVHPSSCTLFAECDEATRLVAELGKAVEEARQAEEEAGVPVLLKNDVELV